MNDWAAGADEHGILTLADLRRAGLAPRDIGCLVRDGRLTALARGWYALGTPPRPEWKHIQTTWAMLRSHDGRVVASHHSALLLLGLPTYRADLSRVRLSRRTPGSSRTRSGQSVGRVVPMEAQREHTVAPALAVVQHGVSSGSLSALIAADGALRQGLATPEELVQALDWVHQHPKSAGIRPFLALADGRHESPGETRLAHALHLMKVTATPQLEITATGFRAIVDFALTGERVVLEFDGKVKYGRSAETPDPFGRVRTPGDVVWEEKRREDRLRELGYEVVRVTWDDLDDLAALAKRIAEAVRRARARRLSGLSA